MSCQLLANQYVEEDPVNNKVPPPDSSIDERQKWLLRQMWCCQYKNGDQENYIDCDRNNCANAKVYVTPILNDPDPNKSGGYRQGAPLTILKEDKFLAWVNERGMQCINKVVGRINAIPTDHGTEYKLPGPDVPFAKGYCSGPCYNVLPGQIECFECIKKTLEDQTVSTNERKRLDSLCPALYNGTTIKEVDTNLMQQSLSCHSCVADNSKNLTNSVEVSPGVYSTTYNEDAFNRVWGCVTGNFPFEWTSGITIGIVIAVIVLLILGGIGIWFYIRKKKEKTKQINLSMLNQMKD